MILLKKGKIKIPLAHNFFLFLFLWINKFISVTFNCTKWQPRR